MLASDKQNSNKVVSIINKLSTLEATNELILIETTNQSSLTTELDKVEGYETNAKKVKFLKQLLMDRLCNKLDPTLHISNEWVERKAFLYNKNEESKIDFGKSKFVQELGNSFND